MYVICWVSGYLIYNVCLINSYLLLGVFMNKLLILIGALIFLCVSMLSLFLLKSKLISGGEFSAIFIAFAVISLLITLLPEVQKFSIAGNSVTFKEVKQEAENTIIEMKSVQMDTLRLLLTSIVQTSSLKGIDAVFPESRRFWDLYKKINNSGYEKELSPEILTTTEQLLRSYLWLFINSSNEVKLNISDNSEKLSSPQELTAIIMGEKQFKHKEFISDGLPEYQKLYDLHTEINKNYNRAIKGN